MFELYFIDKENYDLYLSKNKFEVLEKKEDTFYVLVSFPKDKYDEFFSSLDDTVLVKFQEKPFTLQDYFMSFYKEQREFGGLSGVAGNTKEGLKNEKR